MPQPAFRFPQTSSAQLHGFVMTTLEQRTQFSHALSAPVSPVAGKRKASAATAEERAHERRIRRRVDPAKRKRVAIACESCKRRKQKCSGEEPCNVCSHRGFPCRYVDEGGTASMGTSPGQAKSQPSPNVSSKSPFKPPRNGRGSPNTRSPTTEASDDEVVAVGDATSRLLRDPRGHLRFIGESGAHSFLEQVRQLFRQTSGESQFTLDVDRFNMVDGPHHLAVSATLQLPNRAFADELVDLFETNVQPFSYVFHMEDLRQLVHEAYKNPMECPQSWLCLIQLVFALASVYKPEFESRRFFESAIGFCQDSVEDGDFWIVQAYLMISLYYQLTCKRNAFWIAIGMAIRFAQALGLHRECVNRSLPLRDRLLRRRIWRTLFIHDKFHSAALGRPSAIEDGDWDDRDSSDISEEDRLTVEQVNVAAILGDICREVYRPRTISSEAASSLARRLQEWSDNLPQHMTVHTLLHNKSLSAFHRFALNRLHQAHLNAVILLSRPFFFYVVASAVTNQTPAPMPPRKASGTVARLARACLLSAVRSVELVQTLFVDNVIPYRPPFLIYFMFLSGIILLLEAYRDKSFLNSPSISSVKIIMRAFALVDPGASRYIHIFEDMEAAIKGAREKQENIQARDILGELLDGDRPSPMIPHNPSSIGDTRSPSDISLSQFLVDGPSVLVGEGDPTYNFDFESLSYWDSIMVGEGDFRGLLLNPEF